MPEPEQERPSPPRRELRIKRPMSLGAPPQSVQIPVEQGLPPQRGPSLLHKLLWVILAGWLLCLAFMLLDPLPFLFPDEDSAGSWWRWGEASTSATPEDDVTAPDKPELTALKQKVATAIVNDDLNRAMMLIRQQRQSPEIYPYQDELMELGKALTALKHVNTTVADILRAHIDEEVVIRVKNRSLKIIPRASAGDRINALVVASRADQPRCSATFKITDLAPLERSRLIGKADTPLKCLMKLHLHLEAGDRDAARAFAPSCGILADALQEQFRSPSP